MAEGAGSNRNAEGDLYRDMLDNLYDGVYFVDPDSVITYWNKGAERITGFAASEVIGARCAKSVLRHVDSGGHPICETACPLKETLNDGRPREVELYLHHKSGHLVPVLVRVTALRDPNLRITGAVEIFSDTTFMEVATRRIQELERIALLDPLTGIGNRRFLEMTLRARLSEAFRYDWSLGVLFIDIDHFKDVNDRHGHDVGDLVLKMVATTVANSLRPFDVVARWGGEEFIALLINVEQEELCAIAERAKALVELSGFERGPEVINVTVSIGATRSRPDDTLGKVISRADGLMYQSKSRGRNCVCTDPAG